MLIRQWVEWMNQVFLRGVTRKLFFELLQNTFNWGITEHARTQAEKALGGVRDREEKLLKAAARGERVSFVYTSKIHVHQVHVNS